jgi:hypothetical protein
MHILVMVLFLTVWLLILWLGSIALEATGLERTKARFQALSALAGAGFTTREAESIVEHPDRRRITAYLIFLGNVGITAFIILLLLYVRAGLETPSIFVIALTITILLIIGLVFWSGLLDKLTNAILDLCGKWRAGPGVAVAEEIFHQAGDYGVFSLIVGQRTNIAGLKLKDAGFQEQDITVLAIERGDSVLSRPEQEERLLAGDYLLCYGKPAAIGILTRTTST